MSYRHSTSKSEELTVYAKRIKKLREDHNETQEEFGKVIKCSKNVIANIEQGKSDPTLETAIAIACNYKVSVDYICGLTEDMTISSTILDTLCRYISLETKTMRMVQSHEIPVISISKSFFDYLKDLVTADQLKKKDVPDEVINAWLKSEAEKVKASLRDEKGGTVKFALLSNRDISSDEVMELIERTYKESQE